MTKTKVTFLFIVLFCMFGTNVSAHDIAVANAKGVTIYYNWINNQTELAVSYWGDDYSYTKNYKYSGTIEIPESVEYENATYKVTSINEYAFYECGSLTSVTIPNSVTFIGNYAFKECSGLSSVTIRNSVTSIGNAAFYGCKGLTSFTIPNNLISIGEQAFSGCDGIIYMTIPKSVTSIGGGAFSGCI